MIIKTIQKLKIILQEPLYAQWIGSLAVFIAALLFSAKAILIKLAFHYPVDPVSLLCLRMLFALPFFIGVAVYMLQKNQGKITTPLLLSDYWKLIGLGVLGYYAASILDFWGLQYVTAGQERLILFIYPTLVVLISWVVYQKKIGWVEIVALLLSYAGIGIVFLRHSFATQPHIWLGVVLIFGSAFTYAVYLVGSGRLIPKFGASRFNAYSMIVSSIAIIIHYLIAYPQSLWHYPPVIYGYSLSIAIFSTVIPTFLIAVGIQLIGAGRAAIIASVGPVSTIILGYFFLGEIIHTPEIIGTILVLAGVLLVSTRKNK